MQDLVLGRRVKQSRISQLLRRHLAREGSDHSCLCGGVQLVVEEFVGPFELCHCRRCRKASGSAFKALVGVRRTGFRFLHGEDLIRTFEAPIIESPPAYENAWCMRCGSPTPVVPAVGDWFEVPAGLFDEDLPINPDKHIFADLKPNWDTITDDLPRFDKALLIEHRRNSLS